MSDKNLKKYDLIVIGSGIAGFYAAMQASKLGKKVCIVEKTFGKLGGSWIQLGTLPSKALREGLATIHSIESHVGKEWVNRVVDDLHTGKLFGRAKAVSEQEEVLIRKYLDKNNIEVIEGYGLLEDRYAVRVLPSEGKPFVLSGQHTLIATGSRPRRPPEIPFDGWRVVDSDEILALEQIPSTLVIYGAGVIGCEYACIFAAMGVDVTVVDSRKRILQYMDFEACDELQKSMEALGVKFSLGKSLDSISYNGPLVVSSYDDKTTLTAEVFFYAAGRVSNTDRIGLEKLGIPVNDRSGIVVNSNFQTNIANIYAAGDAIGSPALASTSFQQGRHVASHAFGKTLGDFPKLYPIGVYTIPEASMIGKTEEELKKEGAAYVVGRAYYSEIARGYIRGDSHGLMKLLICVKTQKILGIHIVGADACNLVHIGLAFMIRGGFAQDFISMIFNYPTLAEGYRIAAFNGLNKIFKDGLIRPPKDRRQSEYLYQNYDESGDEEADLTNVTPLAGVGS